MELLFATCSKLLLNNKALAILALTICSVDGMLGSIHTLPLFNILTAAIAEFLYWNSNPKLAKLIQLFWPSIFLTGIILISFPNLSLAKPQSPLFAKLLSGLYTINSHALSLDWSGLGWFSRCLFGHLVYLDVHWSATSTCLDWSLLVILSRSLILDGFASSSGNSSGTWLCV